MDDPGRRHARIPTFEHRRKKEYALILHLNRRFSVFPRANHFINTAPQIRHRYNVVRINPLRIASLCYRRRDVSFGSFPPRLRYITRLIKLSLFSVNYSSNSPTFSHYGTRTRERRRPVRDSPVEFQMNVHSRIKDRSFTFFFLPFSFFPLLSLSLDFFQAADTLSVK